MHCQIYLYIHTNPTLWCLTSLGMYRYVSNKYPQMSPTSFIDPGCKVSDAEYKLWNMSLWMRDFRQWWRQNELLKRLSTSTWLHGATSKKTLNFISLWNFLRLLVTFSHFLPNIFLVFCSQAVSYIRQSDAGVSPRTSGFHLVQLPLRLMADEVAVGHVACFSGFFDFPLLTVTIIATYPKRLSWQSSVLSNTFLPEGKK
jgi:hypothetical protein